MRAPVLLSLLCCGVAHAGALGSGTLGDSSMGGVGLGGSAMGRGGVSVSPPTIEITSPGSGGAYDATASSVTVSGTTTGDPTAVTWKIGAGSTTACTTGSGTFSCSVTGLTANAANTITIDASNAGGSATPDTQAITYLAPCGSGVTPLVWYRAQSEALANNDPVTTLTSLGSISGANATQATSSAKPTFLSSCINGEACASFDGGDWLRTTTITATVQPYTLCVVSGPTTASTGAHQSAVHGENGTNLATIFVALTTAAWSGSTGTTVAGGSATSGSLDVVCLHANGGSSTIEVNGSPTAGNAGANSVDGFTMGGNSSPSPGSILNGRFAAAWLCSNDERTDGKAYADADFGSSWPKAW